MPSFPREYSDLLRYFTSGNHARFRSGVWPDNLYPRHAESAGWRYMHVASQGRGYRPVYMPEEDDFLPEHLRRAEKRLRELVVREPDVVLALRLRFGERMREELAAFGDCAPVALEFGARAELRGAGNLAEQSPPWARRPGWMRLTLPSLGYRVLEKKATPDQAELAGAVRRWCDARVTWALSRYAGRADARPA